MSSPLKEFSDWEYRHLAALGHKLGGPEVARKLLACDKVTVSFEFAEKRATITATAPTFGVWKTVKIGTGYKNGEDFCFALKSDCLLDDWAYYVLTQTTLTVATQEEDVDLVNLSVADLGFKERARYGAICARAFELGLQRCPAEVGPQLRLQYPDQPCGERLLIAMEAIVGLRDCRGVFRVRNDVFGRWLDGNYGYPDHFYDSDSRFVFWVRKQPSAA